MTAECAACRITGGGEDVVVATVPHCPPHCPLRSKALAVPAALILPLSPLCRACLCGVQDPRPFWGTIGDILDGLGYVRPSIRLPFALVYFLALIAETVSWVLSPIVRVPVGNFTRPRITLSVCERQVSSEKARRDFGYVPEVSMAEGIKRTIAHFRAKGLTAVPGKRGSKKEAAKPARL